MKKARVEREVWDLPLGLTPGLIPRIPPWCVNIWELPCWGALSSWNWAVGFWGRVCLGPKQDVVSRGSVGNGFCFICKKQTGLLEWIEFAMSNCTCLQPFLVRAGVMLALRICLIWVLLCRYSGNSKSYTFIKGSRHILFCSPDSTQREVLRFLSTTAFAFNRKCALALQRATYPFFGL